MTAASSSPALSPAAPAAAAAPSPAQQEPACPAIQTYPIAVAVYDVEGGQQICDADVSMTDVSDGRPLPVQRNPSSCRALALDGWNGEFAVKGSRSGFEPAEERVHVVKTRCGYDTAQVTLWLKAAAAGGK
jgi:hypothetical protein